jgi:hypothetical protein
MARTGVRKTAPYTGASTLRLRCMNDRPVEGHDLGTPGRLARAVAVRNDRSKPDPVRRAGPRNSDVISPYGRPLMVCGGLGLINCWRLRSGLTCIAVPAGYSRASADVGP